MDILTHTLSGIAIGTVVSSFSNRGFTDKLKITLLSGFAGALPDLDAISLWSGFDSSIGNFFNISQTGKEIYSGKLWYSHHAFLHSAFAGILISGIIGVIIYGLECLLKKDNCVSWTESFKRNRLLLIGFVMGFLIHLIEDMPTPASTWDGVNFFWPLKSYIGGTGDIWWWNNYDIFLIVLSIITVNLIFSLIRLFVKFDFRKISIGVLLVGFTIALIQIKTREFNFAYSGNAVNYQEFENKSKQIQKEILGDRIYTLMVKFDNKMKINF